MIRDAIIDEVRAVRDEMAKECGDDVHELFRAIRRQEASDPTHVVSLLSQVAKREAAAAGGERNTTSPIR